MHRPVKSWFSRSWLFQYLNRYHFLHHRHMGTNFNILFLGWDWIFLTAAKPSQAEQNESDKKTWLVRPSRVTAQLL
jgi:sterol desaturase/sphingolipid hydroxylase (fatty acid hydroxylase superfamily)